jgi:hypothetical protein
MCPCISLYNQYRDECNFGMSQISSWKNKKRWTTLSWLDGAAHLPLALYKNSSLSCLTSLVVHKNPSVSHGSKAAAEPTQEDGREGLHEQWSSVCHGSEATAALPCGEFEVGVGPTGGPPMWGIWGRHGPYQRWWSSRAVDPRKTWALVAAALLCGGSESDLVAAALLCGGFEGDLATVGEGGRVTWLRVRHGGRVPRWQLPWSRVSVCEGAEKKEKGTESRVWALKEMSSCPCTMEFNGALLNQTRPNTIGKRYSFVGHNRWIYLLNRWT